MGGRVGGREGDWEKEIQRNIQFCGLAFVYTCIYMYMNKVLV